MGTSTPADPAEGFVPTTVPAAAPRWTAADPVPVRIAYEIFGRTHPGTDDPVHDRYGYLDGKIYLAVGDRTEVYVEGVDGTRYLLGPGRMYYPTGDREWPDGVDPVTLDGSDPVIGEQDGRGGYRAFGVNAVVYRPE